MFAFFGMNSPWNSPLVNDEETHITKSTEEEQLLRKPLEKEIEVIFEVIAVHHFEKDG